MTRVTKRDRHRLRRKTAKLGEELLRTRDTRGYWQDGYETFDEYVEQELPAAWGVSSEQAVELAEAAIEAASRRRRKARS